MYRSLIVCLAALTGGSLSIPANAQPPDTPFGVFEQKIPNSSVSFKMIPIPAGSFLTGSRAAKKGSQAHEGPSTRVKVDSFWIEEHEVTYDEYILFQDEALETGPLPDGITRPSPPYIDFTLGMGKAGGFPANSMSRYAAIMYCKWLYQKTHVFYRLPTEAEWEYACRAGSSAAYPFGDDEKQLSHYAWWGGNSENKYHAVKQLAPNAWGLYDMLGNVAEWTLDQSPGILKGGSFPDGAAALRSAARLPYDHTWNARDPQIPKSKWWNTDAPFIGFRVVRPVKQPDAAAADHLFTQFLTLK